MKLNFNGPFLAGYRKAGGPLKCKRPVLSAFQDEAVDEVEDPTPEMSIESQETLIEVPGGPGDLGGDSQFG